MSVSVGHLKGAPLSPSIERIMKTIIPCWKNHVPLNDGYYWYRETGSTVEEIVFYQNFEGTATIFKAGVAFGHPCYGEFWGEQLTQPFLLKTSETPQTDSQEFTIWDYKISELPEKRTVVESDFARKLETELYRVKHQTKIRLEDAKTHEKALCNMINNKKHS